MRPIGIGFGNVVIDERIIGVISPDTAPSKRVKEEAKLQQKLIDATYGRKTRALIIMDSGHVVMSAINPETISARITGKDSGNEG